MEGESELRWVSVLESALWSVFYWSTAVVEGAHVFGDGAGSVLQHRWRLRFDQGAVAWTDDAKSFGLVKWRIDWVLVCWICASFVEWTGGSIPSAYGVGFSGGSWFLDTFGSSCEWERVWWEISSFWRMNFDRQFGLFFGTLSGQSTSSQFSYWAEKGAMNLHGMIGCFAMTELGYETRRGGSI